MAPGWRQTFAAAFFRELIFLKTSRWDLALSTVLPAIVLVAAGWLFSGGTPRDLPVVLVDRDHSAFSRMAAVKFDAAPGLAIAFVRDDPAAAFSIVRRGDAYGAILIPKDAGREVKAGRGAHILLYTASSYYTAAATVQREAGYVASDLAAQAAKADTARIDPRRVRPPPVSVQTTTLFNPNTSYEWMLAAPLQVALIVLMISCAAIVAVAREFSGGRFGAWIGPGAPIGAAVLGKFAPYLALYFVYGTICIVWQALARGYPVAGSVWLLTAGYGLMLAVYALFGAMLAAICRDAVMAMGATAVYASSAMAFSGAFFPMRGADLFAQSWNAIQPYTWFVRLSMQVWQMGVPDAVALKTLAVLGVMVAVTGAGAWLGLYGVRRDAERGKL